VPDRAIIEAGEAALIAGSAAASTVTSIESKDVLDAIRWLTSTTSAACSVASESARVVAEHASVAQPLAVEKLLQLNPPLGVAFAVSVLRAVPTCIVIVLAEVATIFNLFFLGHGQLSHLSLPLVMMPFALSELVSVAKAIGIRRGLRTLVNSKSLTETDGMTVLLWSSPKLSTAWMQFKAADARLGSMSGSLFRALLAPRQVLFPDEEAIRAAPEFRGEIAYKLVSAWLVDLVGIATFSVPVLGEVVDVLWAPVSAFLIQRMFGLVYSSSLKLYELARILMLLLVNCSEWWDSRLLGFLRSCFHLQT